MTADHVIAVLNVAALVTIMLSMGLQVTLASALASARPAMLVVWCIVGNFVLMPAVALALLYQFNANSMVTIGFFILAVCPGAPVGPPLTALAKGNLSLAIAMMVILAGLSSVLAPALLSVLLIRVAPNSNVELEFVAIARTLLVLQILPLAVGFMIHQFAPKLTAWINRPVDVLAKLLMLLLLAGILVTQFSMLAEIRMRGWIGMCLLLASSLLIGWLCGGSEVSNRRAIAVTTGPRNAAVGLVIAGNNFANTPAVTAVVAYGVMSMVGTMLFAIILAKLTATRTDTPVSRPTG